MAGFQRPEGGWRAHFQGIKINAPADSIEATKSPYSQNIRSYDIQTVATRPGYDLLFATTNAAITDIRAYAALATDSMPRFLARNANNQIYLDNGTLVGTLAGTSLGAWMIPFRPNQSPNPYMYIGTQNDYQKFSVPNSLNAVTMSNVGLEEQQNPPSACPESFAVYEFTGNAAAWTPGGTGGATSDTFRLPVSNIGSIFADPASGVDKRYSLEVANTDEFQLGMVIELDKGGDNIITVVQDVLPPINGNTNLVIASIFYYAGTTGRCVIAATQFPSNATSPTFQAGNPQAASIYTDSVIASLRRSALVKLAHGATTEKCFVLSTTTGPDGTICFEVSTANAFVAGDVISGIGAIVVTGANLVTAGDTIQSASVSSTTSGTGTANYAQALGTNPFEQLMNPTNEIAQQDDYIGIGINISDLSKLVIGTIKFNVDQTVNYTDNYFYIQFTVNDLVFHPPAATQVTQVVDNPAANNTDLSFQGNVQPNPVVVTTTVPLPSNQWTTLFVPTRQLIRAGNNLNRTLSDCNGIRIEVQTTDVVTIAFGGLFVGGGGHPDVGANTPLFYITRGRSSVTGVKSNPSPATRYNVSPRRQPNILFMTDTTGDAQMDTWDIFRFGGTITSWRYVGSTRKTGGTDSFVDNYFDTAAAAGDLLEYDNFEPWPTIDVPFNITAGTVNGITTTIRVTGTTILVIWSAAAPFTNPAPATILRWLPGTLVTVGSQTAYTFWTRPTAQTLAAPPAANYYAYLFQLVENAGTATPTTLSVLEPKVANQHLPYLWGPDAEGTVFGTGDPFRPGNFYFSKLNQPDSAPDSYNQEITQPSEPLLGGEVINGIALVASSSRWWKLYPNFGSVATRYQPVEAPVSRGLAAPYAHCTDGKIIYFVAKDGIWMTSGGIGVSLTDTDLYPLFPHEGINTPVDYIYNSREVAAPDYKYAGDFRLAYCNSYLFFDYRDSNGVARTLVCDLRDMANPAWIVDNYADLIIRHYTVEQPEGTVLTASTRYAMMVLTDTAGKVYTEVANHNDNSAPIIGVYGTFEYNGGDIREDQLFNDAFLDLTPRSSVNVVPVVGGVSVGSHIVPVSTNRIQTNAPIGMELKYMGVTFNWSDHFDLIDGPTTIFAWQPMYQGVPVSVTQWKTQGTSFGWASYGHLRQWNFAYRATAPVTITITVQDGTAPLPLVLPSTGGLLKKTMFPFTFNKAMLYFFTGVSSEEWAPYLSESDLYVGEWGRQGPYQLAHDIEAPVGIRS
jgi:hypothetical protein